MHLLRESWDLLKATVLGWVEDQVPRLSAAVSFFTILSLSPLVIIATSIAGFFFSSDVARTELIEQVRQLTGAQGGDVVQRVLEEADFSSDRSIWSGVIGLAILFFSSTAVFVQLQSGLNKIWDVQAEDLEGSLFKRLLVVRGLSLAMVLAIGFLLLVSLVVSALLSVFRNYLTSIWAQLDLAAIVLHAVVSFVLIGLLFTLMLRVLPDAKVAPRAAWIGGFATAALLALGKRGIGIYLGNSAVGSAYGAAGSLVVFLLWIYFSMLVFFLGAEFTHELSERELKRRGGAEAGQK